MASVVIVSINNDTAGVSLVLNTAGDTVTGVTAFNNGVTSILVSVDRPSGNVTSRTLAPGASATISLPKGKQFPYGSDALSDWTVSLTVV